MANYSELQNVSPEILQAVERMGFTEMTEIQEKAIPVMLEGHEIIAKAPTGTGKTCAFGIPLIEKVDPDLLQVQAIVLCPTRELCTQITEDLRNLAFFKHGLKVVAVYGGQPIDKQIGALKRGAQVVVATPGRLLDHMHRRTINISKAKIAVLDEADEMLDMGFYKDVCKILDALPKEKQMVMFSATISREVMDIGWIYQRDTVELTVEPVQDSEPRISQYMIESVGRQKLADLQQAGTDPFQRTSWPQADFSAEVKEHYEDLPEDAAPEQRRQVCMAGRMMSKRVMGKASFADLRDTTGDIQMYVRRDDVGTEEYQAFKKFDIGDVVGIRGYVFRCLLYTSRCV